MNFIYFKLFNFQHVKLGNFLVLCEQYNPKIFQRALPRTFLESSAFDGQWLGSFSK